MAQSSGLKEPKVEIVPSEGTAELRRHTSKQEKKKYFSARFGSEKSSVLGETAAAAVHLLGEEKSESLYIAAGRVPGKTSFQVTKYYEELMR
jgi:hypothetical protein